MSPEELADRNRLVRRYLNRALLSLDEAWHEATTMQEQEAIERATAAVNEALDGAW